MSNGTLRACVVAVMFAVGSVRAVDEQDRAVISPGASTEQQPARTILADDISSDRLRPLPADARVITHYAAHPGKQEVESSTVGTPDDKLVYSNTNGAHVYSPGRFYRIADDLYTNLTGFCQLSGFSLRVNGGVEDGGGTFDVTIRLQKACPNTVPYNAPGIPGTEFTFAALDDDMSVLHDLIIDFDDPNSGVCADGKACRISIQDCADGSACYPFGWSDFGVCDDNTYCRRSEQNCAEGSECVATDKPVIPPTVWVRVELSTNRAGWVVGAPPNVGFSTDQYSHVITGCNTWFGGYPAKAHASFFAELWTPADCSTQYVAYQAKGDRRAPPLDLPPGTEFFRFLDDIELSVCECELSTIEIATKGRNGPYEMDFDLREFPTVDPVPGTDITWECSDSARCGQGNLRIARLAFGPYLFIDRDFFISWKANKPRTGVLNAGENQVGYSSPRFWGTYGSWDGDELPDGTPAIFDIAIYCRGETPLGACCPDQPDVPGEEVPLCLSEVPAMECVGGRWLRDATCPSSNYDPEDPWAQRGEPPCGTQACCLPDHTCAHLTHDECEAIGDDTGYSTTWFPRDFCEGEAQECPAICPSADGAVEWYDPPPGVVDARQPRVIDSAHSLQGIDTFSVGAPPGAEPECWTLCETQQEYWYRFNKVDHVVDHGDGEYAIVLDRRITPGGVTKITYTDNNGIKHTGKFTSLPADVSADGISNTDDILSLIDCCLNEVCTPAWGIYSCDIDHSGVVNTADILRTIDLLNGAGSFRSWNLATPHDDGECPD
ncbi:MAG: hypothetical protein JSU63_19135 [Phycisphaerales bacterium]|nr:MAG: hypothetical protein JSU63_19135 [Phycisphaerales bacterium]